MPTSSVKKQRRSARHHCRFCNHSLEQARQRCPACKQQQGRPGH